MFGRGDVTCGSPAGFRTGCWTGCCRGRVACFGCDVGGSVAADDGSTLGCFGFFVSKADSAKIENRSCKGRPLTVLPAPVAEGVEMEGVEVEGAEVEGVEVEDGEGEGGVEVVFGRESAVRKSRGSGRVTNGVAGRASVPVDGLVVVGANVRLTGIRTGVFGDRPVRVDGE